jgi:hypothetical protein
VTRRALAVLGAAVAVAGCGGSATPRDPAAVPTPVAVGAAFRPPAAPPQVAAGQPVAGLACAATGAPRYRVHVELFVRGLVVLLPAGIGRGPGCDYPLRTTEPTGLVEVAGRAPRTLGELFAVWGQPLRRDRVGRFRGAVVAYVDGRLQTTEPAAIPLTRHAEIVLEVGLPRVPPHRGYRFPPE